jgi:hypothetical protein
MVVLQYQPAVGNTEANEHQANRHLACWYLVRTASSVGIMGWGLDDWTRETAMQLRQAAVQIITSSDEVYYNNVLS